jgi:hypothetical protein
MDGSLALDRGMAFGLTIDERGLPRPVDVANISNATGGDGSDIGAFEKQEMITTAAEVSVSGKVVTASGEGLRGAIVTMMDAAGVKRTALTNGFGYFRFDGITAGQACIFDVKAKRYVFDTQVRVVNDTLDDIVLTAH